MRELKMKLNKISFQSERMRGLKTAPRKRG